MPEYKATAYKLQRSPLKTKKWMITTPEGKKIHFGQAGASDYTINKDPTRKEAYLARHKAREDWSKSGIKTPGFWSRYLLWSETTLSEAIKKTNDKFDIHIVKKRDYKATA